MTLQVVETTIGDAQVFQIVEIQIGDPVRSLFPDARPDEVRKIGWLGYPYVNSDGTLNAVSQAFIVRIGDRIMGVDTCIGNDKQRAESPDWSNLATDFLETLTAIGIDPAAVTDVICTHLHMDHVGWNTIKAADGSWVPTFPKARYYFARKEYEFWADKLGQKLLGAGQDEAFLDSIKPVMDAGLAELIDEAADLGDGIRVMPTPGHTIGHISIVFDTGDKRFIISGDCMHHPCQIARPEWCNVADYDKAQSEATRRGFFADVADGQTIVAGTHFSVPSIGTIIGSDKDGFQFKALGKG